MSTSSFHRPESAAELTHSSGETDTKTNLNGHAADKTLPSDPGFKFMDLGCAPGGFSSFLLDDERCLGGAGVTLSSSAGGFPTRLRRPNFFMQQRDLFELVPEDLLYSSS